MTDMVGSYVKACVVLITLLLRMSMAIADGPPVLVELPDKIAALYPHSDTTLWLKTDKGLFEFNTVNKRMTCLFDATKSGRYVVSDISWRYGVYTIAEKQRDGTYVYHMHVGDVIHNIPSKLYISRLDYCKPAKKLVLDGYDEKGRHPAAVFTDLAGKPYAALAKRFVGDEIVVPVEHDASLMVGFNGHILQNIRRNAACARIKQSGEVQWEFPINAGYRIIAISVAPKRDTVLVMGDFVAPPAPSGDVHAKLWVIRLSDGTLRKEVALWGGVQGISLSPSQEYAALFGENKSRVIRLPECTMIREHEILDIGFGVADVVVTSVGDMLCYHRPFSVKGPATITRVRTDGTTSLLWTGDYIPDGEPMFRHPALVPFGDSVVLFRRGNQVRMIAW